MLIGSAPLRFTALALVILATAACGARSVLDGGENNGGDSGGAGSGGSNGSGGSAAGAAGDGMGPGGAGTGTTWSPFDKQQNIVLSNGNLTATSGFDSFNDSVRATTERGGGKWYFEVTVDLQQDGFYTVGLADGLEDLELSAGDTSSGCGYHSEGTIQCNGGETMTFSSDAAYKTGDVIGVAVDFAPSSAFFSRNGQWVFGGPEETTGFPLGSGSIFPMVTVSQSDRATANFGATGFLFGPPAGFAAGW